MHEQEEHQQEDQKGCKTFPAKSQVMESFHGNSNQQHSLNFISKWTTGTVLTGGAKVQVIGHRSVYRSQATDQVTGQTTGHRSGHRSDHRSHAKTLGHWTKLFLIDILLYKNKTSQRTSIIFFLFWTLPDPTHEKIYSCLSRKEDLRYSVTKVRNEITKVRKITWFVRKNESQNEGLLR